MFIKTLTIQGFKSYRDQTQIEPFSPRHNVVVGRNGSGKSNFFSAIRFVLSDAYTSMSREERQALLHEGVSATTTLSAYGPFQDILSDSLIDLPTVEIVFDNSDNRFPTGRDEVILRRTIGLKKDEYSLDKKTSSKADVMNLLESAGFSKSNPYYIVPQGRITALTNAKDHERLALLKEVAGTKVYEHRRAESLRIVAETDTKRTKISELIDYIDSRLTELEEEKEELREFQEQDKDRRCIEYALYLRELDEVAQTLVEIDEDRRGEVHGANQRREQFTDRQKEMQRLEKRVSDIENELQTVAVTRNGAQSELTDLVGTRTELQCIVDDLRSAGALAGGKRTKIEAELATLARQISAREDELRELLPDWENRRMQEGGEKRRLEEADTKLKALFAKQGRMKRFRTKAERDVYLRGEIASIQAYQDSQTSALEATRADLAASRKSQAELEQNIVAVHGRIEDGRKRVKDLIDQALQLKDQHARLTERRKELWREDTKHDTLVKQALEQMKKAEGVLATLMDKDTGLGLRAVDKIAERHNLHGVYGPLYRLFEVTDPNFNMAVELTAGNSLFHIVVDTDNTASQVLEIMLKEKTGRVTFMPLNRLKPKHSTPPNAQDAIPLIDKLRYDPLHVKAFQQVFGKTCVCRDLTIAAAYVKSHGINTITLDGDKVDRKGALTGGYHDVRRSRIEAVKDVQSWRSKYETDEKKSGEVKAAITQIEQEITKVVGEISAISSRQNQTRDLRERLLEEGTALTKHAERQKERVLRLEGEVDELEADLNSSRAKLETLRAELLGPLTVGLTIEEEGMIDMLGREVERRRKDVVELGRVKNTLESRKNALEIELNEKLKRRREELQAGLEALDETENDGPQSVENLAIRTRELKNINVSIASLHEKIQEMEGETEERTKELQELRASLERLQNQQTEDGRSINRMQKFTERYLAKRQMLLSRKDECNRNIRDLGVLPEEAFEKYTSVKPDHLVKKLHAVNEGLKKFAHVNKKAFEQYSNFTKQRDQLLKRREDLDKSAESIEELVEALDQRKDEAIERTFKQVARNFEEVFEQLVPAGRGRLIIQRRIDQDEDADAEVEDTQRSTFDSYTGVSIKVSFNSKVDEGLRIQQLSGGQKSLVALATVFAIQKCDPAPFYLFDEIDANLDAQYRTAVASMIKNLSSTAQFITTTFRPEMLVTADQFYGVLFNNQKVSSIRNIKREEAMEFVDQEAQAQ